jgi:hypothetical protein
MRTFARSPRGFESLESRHMLAGNVTAQIVNGDLIITGDSADNAILVSSFGHPMEVTGRNDAGGNPTNVNGVPNGSFDASGLTGNTVIRMLDGADDVSHSGPFPGALVIEMGNGNDRLGASYFETGTEYVADLGPGTNSIAIRGSTFRDGSLPWIDIGTSAIIRGGEEADDIRISEMSASQTIYIETLGGADIASLSYAEATNFIGMDGGAGDDNLSVNRADSNVISLRSGTGGGALSAFACETVGDLGLIGGDSFINIRVTNSKVGGIAYLIGSGANDYVQVEASQFKELQVNTAAGFDRLDINGSLLERVFAELGADGDYLVMNNTAISGTGSLSGGEGYDVFFGRGNAFGGATLAFFEQFT